MAVKGVMAGISDWIALVGIAEKGYISLELSTEQKGGHAASPPPQTTVGILSAAIVKLQDNPFPSGLPKRQSGCSNTWGLRCAFP